MDIKKKEVRAYNANAHDTYGSKEFIESHPLSTIKKVFESEKSILFKKVMEFTINKNVKYAIINSKNYVIETGNDINAVWERAKDLEKKRKEKLHIYDVHNDEMADF